MSTARDLISGSMRLIGVLGAGEVPTSDEATNALTTLNDMLDNWSTSNLLIFNKVEEPFNLVAGQQSYTMGTGGNFNTTRPQEIENAVIRTVTGSTTIDLPIDIVNKDQWVAISNKNVQSNYPSKLYTQGTYPLETIELWPIPSLVNSLVLWSRKPLTSIASLDTVIDLPPGYKKALRYNLAVELAPEYGRPLTGEIIEGAAESKGAIKRMNSKPIYLGVDAALISKRGAFNWRTGE